MLRLADALKGEEWTLDMIGICDQALLIVSSTAVDTGVPVLYVPRCLWWSGHGQIKRQEINILASAQRSNIPAQIKRRREHHTE
jgi:hypothetical protein